MFFSIAKFLYLSYFFALYFVKKAKRIWCYFFWRIHVTLTLSSIYKFTKKRKCGPALSIDMPKQIYLGFLKRPFLDLQMPKLDPWKAKADFFGLKKYWFVRLTKALEIRSYKGQNKSLLFESKPLLSSCSLRLLSGLPRQGSLVPGVYHGFIRKSELYIARTSGVAHMVSLLIRTHVGEAADEPAWRERTDPRDSCEHPINRGVRLSMMTIYVGEHIYS